MADRASGFLKKRSRALLADLLRPYLKVVWLLIAVVVIENAARLAIPWLVQRGIDYGIPPLMAGGSGDRAVRDDRADARRSGRADRQPDDLPA